MAKLYELAESLNTLIDFIESDENATEQQYAEALNQLGMAFEEKAENLVKYIRNIESDAEAYRVEERRLYERRRSLENKAASIKNYLYSTMKSLHLDKTEAGLFKLRIQANNPSVEILDEAAIPDEYKTYEVIIDKKTLLQDIKSGKMVSGAEAKQGEGVRISGK